MRPDFLTDAVDLHIHSGPDVVARIGTSVDIARAAAAAGMRAIVLKDHVFPSFTKAVLTDQVVEGIRVFGGITMNATAGGINVRAVRSAIAGGARVVMFPSFDTVRYANRPHKSKLQLAHSFGEPPVVLRAVAEDGTVLPETERVLQAISEHPEVILSTGHLGPEEAVPVVERARELGVSRIVVEHPNGNDWFTRADLRRLTDAGAKLNLSYNPYQPIMGKRKFQEILDLLGDVGAEHCTLITDGGQPYNPMPCETLRVFCEMLHQEGVTVADIHLMTRNNPAQLLGLDTPADPVTRS